MSSGFMRSVWSSCEGKGKEKAHTEQSARNAVSLQQETHTNTKQIWGKEWNKNQRMKMIFKTYCCSRAVTDR